MGQVARNRPMSNVNMTVQSISATLTTEQPAQTPSGQPREIVIRPHRGWIGLNWAELWEHRELLYFLVWRDIKSRYKQSVLGAAWAVIQPVCNMIIFTVIFGKVAKMPSENFPYPVFVYAGILPWTFFAGGFRRASYSLVTGRDLLTKVYFPRLFLPAAGVAQGAFDLAISFAVYGFILAAFAVPPSWGIVFLPALVALTAMSAMGVGCILGALNVMYRDVSQVARYIAQMLMYLSPVVYPVSLVPKRFHWLLALNPMAGIIDAYRSAILGKPWNLTTLTVSTASAVALFLFGIFFFRRCERRFADVV